MSVLDKKRPGSSLDSLRRPVLLAFEACCALAIALIVALLGFGALERNITRTSYIQDTDDLVGYLMALLFAFGLAIAHAEGGHVRVDLLYQHYKGAGKRLVDAVFRFIGVISALIITGAGIALAYDSHLRGRSHYGLVEVPDWLPQALIVIGGAVFLIEFLFGDEGTPELPGGSFD